MENSVPAASQNSQATQHEATNPYDELSCTTVQQQSDTDVQLGDGENDFILHPLGASGLAEEVCREFPCTEQLTICDSQRLWDSV